MAMEYFDSSQKYVRISSAHTAAEQTTHRTP